MNEEQVRQLLFASLKTVAPEVDAQSINPNADVRDEVDLDSMDFMRFVRTVHERSGLEIPDGDALKFATLAGAQSYLMTNLPRR